MVDHDERQTQIPLHHQPSIACNNATLDETIFTTVLDNARQSVRGATQDTFALYKTFRKDKISYMHGLMTSICARKVSDATATQKNLTESDD
jgi:hypothetical protein